MLIEEVEACAFNNWYPLFKKVTFDSRILPLPDSVVDYLTSDTGIILPVECDSDNQDENTSSNADDEEWTINDTKTHANDNSKCDEDDCEDDIKRPSFPEFAGLVRSAISELGGSVIPKLNWSAPRDATWIGLANSIKCTTLSEILLLLKSSDFVMHDLTQPYKDCDDFIYQETLEKSKQSYVLVLRRWSDRLNPGNEFRCFVKDHELAGVSQRDNTQHYRHIVEEKDSIRRDIKTFFEEHICSRLQVGGLISEKNGCRNKTSKLCANFVFDVVRLKKDHVRLVDINPFGETTDSLLFEWRELKDFDCTESDNQNVEFRFVEDDAGIQPNGLRHYSVPRDFVDLATGSDPNKLVDFLALQQQTQAE